MAQPIPVVSSNLHSIQYEPSTQVLTVYFLNGTAYNYYDVSAAVWANFQTAASKGKFLASNIKGKYSYERIA